MMLDRKEASANIKSSSSSSSGGSDRADIILKPQKPIKTTGPNGQTVTIEKKKGTGVEGNQIVNLNVVNKKTVVETQCGKECTAKGPSKSTDVINTEAQITNGKTKLVVKETKKNEEINSGKKIKTTEVITSTIEKSPIAKSSSKKTGTGSSSGNKASSNSGSKGISG